MKRMLTVVMLLSAVGMLTNPAGAQVEKVLAIKEIMIRLYKGPNSLSPTIGRELRAEAPPWDHLRQEAHEFTILTVELAALHPARGERASWELLTRASVEHARALENAVTHHDRPAAQAAHARLSEAKGCAACHEAHRK